MSASVINIVKFQLLLFVLTSNANDSTEDEFRFLRKAFDLFDRIEKREISYNNISAILPTLGSKIENRELQSLIKQFDADGSGQIEFEENFPIERKFILEAFHVFDKDGKNYINKSQFREIMRALHDELDEDELDEVMDDFCGDNYKTVSFDEITKVIPEIVEMVTVRNF